MVAPPRASRKTRALDPGKRGPAGSFRDAGLVARLEEELEALRRENTKLRHAAKTVRESEEKYRRFFEDDLTGDVVTAPDGRILACNPAFVKMFGFSSCKDAKDANIMDIYVRPEERAGFLDLLRREGKSENRSLTRRRRDGTLIHIVENVVGWFDEKGKLAEIHGYIYDDSQCKRAEETLRQSEARLFALLGQLPVGVGLIDSEGRSVISNAIFRRFVPAIVPSRDPGNRWRWRTPGPDGKPLPPSEWPTARALRGESVSPGVDSIYTGDDGREVWVRVSSAPFRTETGEIAGIVVVVQDVDAQKRVEEALRKSEATARILLNTPDDIILLIDPGGRFLDANDTMLKKIGKQRDEVIGKTVLDVFPQPVASYRAAYLDEAIRNKMPVRIEEERHGCYYDSIIYPVLDENGSVVRAVIVARDITARKLAEQERDMLLDQLESAHREANLYLDIMTHDIRNANNVSTMYADLIVTLMEGEHRMYAEKLRDSIARSTEILRNVATIRRVHQESIMLAPVDLDTVIREEIGNVPEASIRYEGRVVEVMADSLLSMVLTNLIGNAVKFGGPDAIITVRTEEETGFVRVSVEDTGPGIPDEVKGSLFHRFERGMGHGKGEGLGLFICRTLVERYGGRIWVDDRVPGHAEAGAAFRFALQKV